MAKTIGIYVDSGSSVDTLMRAVTQEVDRNYIVRSLVAEHLDTEKVLDELTVFILPGGADLPYCAKLSGSRNARLRQWVKAGGMYLGICAGAYFGCSAITFQGRDKKISGPRELGFLKGTAVGSIPDLAPLYDFTIKSSAAAPLRTDTGEDIVAYYQGGPFFKIEQEEENVKIVAHYSTVPGDPPAIVETRVGQGKAILSGVHPETSYKEFESLIQILNEQARVSLNKHVTALKTGETGRRKLWRLLLSRCGLKLNSVSF